MSLPIFNGVEKNLSMMQTSWAAMLNPFLSRPTNQINILQDFDLVTGSNVINHRLGRKPQGWFISDIQGVASIYRSAAFNDLTLTLTSSADVTVSIGVF